MSFSQYPGYCESGIDWIGEIPKGWKVEKFRYVFSESGEKIDSEVVGEMLSVSGYRGIEIKEYDDEGRRRTEEELIGYRIVRSGQLVVNTMWLNYAGLGVSEFEGHVSPAYRGYWIDKEVSKEYIHHLMRSSIYVQGYTRLLTGIRPNSLQMGRDDLMGFPIIIPPEDDQTQIARFLDYETARIDALIEEQQRLIELLKEKRQAVISHAVTKGLDPNVPMKDSGVEWLGEVPAHWKITQLKFCTHEMQTGPFGSQLHSEDYVNDGIPLINPAHLIEGRIIPDPEISVDEATWMRLKRHALAKGEIIFARRGELGRCAVVREENENWLCGTGSLKAKLNDRLDANFAYQLVTSKGVVSELKLESKGSTMENLNTETLGKIRLPLPPVVEQRLVVSYAEKVAETMDTLVAEATNAIGLMRERRSALISDAVTGKIDVRNWQPPADKNSEPDQQEAIHG